MAEGIGSVIGGIGSGIAGASPAGAIANAVTGVVDTIGQTISAVVGEQEESHRAFLDWLSLQTMANSKQSSEFNDLIGKSMSGGSTYVTMVIITLILGGLFLTVALTKRK